MHEEGTDVRQVFNEGGAIAISSRNQFTDEVYLALFNINEGDEVMEIKVNLKDLGSMVIARWWRCGQIQIWVKFPMIFIRL